MFDSHIRPARVDDKKQFLVQDTETSRQGTHFVAALEPFQDQL